MQRTTGFCYFVINLKSTRLIIQFDRNYYERRFSVIHIIKKIEIVTKKKNYDLTIFSIAQATDVENFLKVLSLKSKIHFLYELNTIRSKTML